jgi:tetratricopeptide (TPR) repeat protein
MSRILRLGLFFLLLFALPVQASQERAREAFLQGNTFYEQGDHEAAVRAYMSALDQGLTSRELEYNLGNAYLKAGVLGSAVLHYRRALQIDHSYESAVSNLNYARSLTQDVKPEEERQTEMAWVGRLRLGPAAAAALLFIVFTAFILVGGLRLRVWRERFWAAAIQVVLGALVLLLAGATLFEWHQLEGRDEGVIMLSEVDVRSGPGDTYTVGFRLHEGTEVEVLRRSSGWQEVRVSDRLQGWIPDGSIAGI